MFQVVFHFFRGKLTVNGVCATRRMVESVEDGTNQDRASNTTSTRFHARLKGSNDMRLQIVPRDPGPTHLSTGGNVHLVKGV
jgi:hypothetical protein